MEAQIFVGQGKMSFPVTIEQIKCQHEDPWKAVRLFSCLATFLVEIHLYFMWLLESLASIGGDASIIILCRCEATVSASGSNVDEPKLAGDTDCPLNRLL